MATSASPTPLALRCEPVDWTVTTPPIGASITADLPRGEQERRRLSGSLRGHSSIQVTVDLYGHFIPELIDTTSRAWPLTSRHIERNRMQHRHNTTPPRRLFLASNSLK